MFNILTGFTYRGLTPHKFTPMPGVHNRIKTDARSSHRLCEALAYAEKIDEELVVKKWKETCFQKKSEILLIP